jgi:hypothetical protein
MHETRTRNPQVIIVCHLLNQWKTPIDLQVSYISKSTIHPSIFHITYYEYVPRGIASPIQARLSGYLVEHQNVINIFFIFSKCLDDYSPQGFQAGLDDKVRKHSILLTERFCSVRSRL